MKKVLSMAVLICGFGLLISGCPTTTNSGGLAAPEGLRAQAVSVNTISLTWTPVEGASYYKIHRTTDSTWKESVLIDPSIGTSTYSDKGLSANTTYYYRVSARTGSIPHSSDNTESDMSEAASATTNAVGDDANSGGLAVPQGLTAQAVSQTSIRLTWTPVDGASYYKLYRTKDSSWGEYALIDSSVSNSTYLDTGLSANTTYYYKVSAHAGSTSSSSTNPASATTNSDSPPPSQLSTPTGLATAPVNNNKFIQLSWNNIENAYGYRIYVSFSSGGTYTLMSSTTDTGTLITSWGANVPLESGTYYFKVKAYSNNSTFSDSELSAAVSATIP
ncbi:MAG: fibronectin type III domain-containing protein [Treponema sp.]|nr:fibronectin type III domain-containing protein [Treponema sp.]